MATEAALFSLPWPDTTVPGPQVGDGRPFTDAEWRDVWRTAFLGAKPSTGGVFNVPDDAEIDRLEVTSPGANQIAVATGAACVDGLFVPNAAPVALTPASAGAGATRKDRVVLRATWGAGAAQYTTVVAIKTGTQAAPPTLDQTHNSVWEISLATYTINDVGAISALTDERVTTCFGDGGAVPIGGIILWSGSLVTIPWNWRLCDGSDGTPNLQDKFVMGAGSTAVGTTGGANTINLQHGHTQGATGSSGSHSHTQGATGAGSAHTHGAGTLNVPSSGAHTHQFTTGGTPPEAADGSDYNLEVATGAHTHPSISGITAAESAHTHTNPSTSTQANHTHTNPTTASALSAAQDNRPAFYALAYIMRVA